jgi:hypothetical protein
MYSQESLLNTVELVVPGIKYSHGNDVMMAVVGTCFQELFPNSLQYHNLKGCDIGLMESMAWDLVEWGKRIMSDELRRKLELGYRPQFAQVLLNRLGKIIQPALRSSAVLNRYMESSYREHIKGLGANCIIVSSNLQAFDVLNPDIQFIYVVVDLCPEAKVPYVSRNFLANNVIVISVCNRTTEGLKKQGIPPEQIKEIGLPVSIELAKAAIERIELQREDIGKVLVHIGATGPEIPVALKVIKMLVDDGIEVIVFCGDNPNISLAFREQVLQISNKIEVYGGIAGQGREEQLRLLLQVLADPQVNIIVARSNQCILIALALGLKMIAMPGFQTFEEEAYRRICEVNPNTVYADDFIRCGRKLIDRKYFEGGLHFCTSDILKQYLHI